MCLLKKLKIIILPICVLFVLTGCGGDNDYPVAYASYRGIPRVTGYYVHYYDEYQGKLYGYENGEGAGHIWNPVVKSSIDFEFAIPVGAIVYIWIERALGPFESERDFINSGGANIVLPATAPIVIMNRYQEAGVFRVKWDGNDQFGNPQPSGFYYAHIIIDDYRADNIIFLAQDCSYSLPGVDIIGCE